MDTKDSQDSFLTTIGLFLAWLVSSVLVVICGLYVREAVLSIASLIQIAQYQAFKAKGGIGLDFQTGYMVSVFDNVLLLALGIGAISAVIAIEYYVRKGRAKGLHWKRVAKVFGVEIAIIVVSILIRLII